MIRGSDFLDYCLNVRGFSDATLRVYSRALDDFEKTTGVSDPGSITVSMLDEFMTKKALAGLSLNTRRLKGNVMKSFLRFLHSREILPRDPGREFILPREEIGNVPTFTEAEINRLVFLPEPPPPRKKKNDNLYEFKARLAPLIYLRDSAMFGLCYSVGLRAAEIGTIKLEHLTYTDRGDCYVMLKGKGAHKPIAKFVDGKVSRMIDEFLEARRAAGIQHPALFCTIAPKKFKTHPDRGITETVATSALKKRMEQAGIDPKNRHVSLHIFRYSLATHLHERGWPLEKIQPVLRHRSLETTRRYVALGSRKAIDRTAAANLPWNRPPVLR